MGRLIQSSFVLAALAFVFTFHGFAQSQVRVETAPNSSGVVVPSQDLPAGNSITVYPNSRDFLGFFVANVVADSIKLESMTGGIVNGDLVVAANRKSAVFTAHAPGSVRIRAYSGTLTTVASGTITVVPGPANRLRIITEPSPSATAGNVFLQQPVVHIEDSLGNLVSSDNTTSITAARSAGSGILQGTVTMTVVGGVATFTDLFHTTASTISIRFTNSPILIPDTSSDILVSAAPVSKMAYIQQPTNAIAGGAISPAVTVALRDAFDNNVPSAGVAIAIALNSGTGILSGTTPQTTDASGIATFPDLSVDFAGPKQLLASSSGLPSLSSASFTIAPGTANRLTIQTQPSGTSTAGVAFAPQPVVRIEDSFGNLITTDTTTTVTATRAAGIGTLQGSLTATASGGIATFSNLAHNVANTITIEFTSSPILVPDISGNIVVNPSSASKVAFLQQPTNTAGGSLISPSVTVQLQDAFDNNVSSPGVDIAMALTTGTGTLSGTTPRTTSASGLATFSDLSINTVGTKVLTASSTGLTSAVSNAFVVASGTPATIVASGGTPQSTTVNTTFATNLQATVLDAGSNPVSGVTVTFGQPGSGASGNFAGGTNTAITNASGVATAPSFSANTIAGPYTVAATVSGAGSPANFSLRNLPGIAATIAASGGTPQSAQVNSTFGTNFQVTVRDSFNNPVGNVLVTFVPPVSGAGGSFAGGVNSAFTDSNGVATAAVFTANTIAGTYVVSANVSGVTGSAIFSLTNTAGPAVTIAAFSGTPQTATVGTPFANALNAIVKDAFSNPVNGASVTFNAPTTGVSGTFAGGATSVTVSADAAGIATSTSFTANSTTGSYSVSASATGVATSAAFSLRNTAGAAASIAATAGTPQSAQVTTTFATNLRATVRDQFANPVGGIAVTFTAPGAGPSGTFSGGSNNVVVTTDSNGVAIASVFRANTIAGSYSVGGSVAGVTPATFALTNIAGPPATIIVSAGTPQGTEIATQFPTNMQVLVRDSVNNPVSNVQVTFTAPASGQAPTGTFPGPTNSITVFTLSDGRATAPNFVANVVAGAYIVTASATGIGTAAQFNLTNNPSSPSSISAIAGTPQSAQIGTQFATNLKALVKDVANNPVPNVPVTFTAPSTGASGTFGGSPTTIVDTDQSGVATATALIANNSQGSYPVNATVGSVGTAAQFALTNLSGPPGSIISTAGTPQTAVVRTAFGTNLRVLVRDGSGNPVSDGTIVTFTAPASGATGRFANGLHSITAATNEDGLATASVLTADSVAGAFQVSASAGEVSTPALFDLTNTAGSPSRILTVSGTPQSAQIGTPFASNLKAKVTDAYGNPIRLVLVTFNAPTSGAGGTFAGGVNTATTDSGGVATAPQFTANQTAGTYAVAAGASGIGVQAQFVLTNTSGGAALIATAGGTPQSATVGTAFAVNLRVRVLDSQSNPVRSALVTFTAPSSGASGVFAGTANVFSDTTNFDGYATAAVFTANNIAGSGYSVSASVAGVSTPAIFLLTNTAGAPTSLTATAGTPQTAQVNTNFATNLQITVKDASNNPVPNVQVTFTAPSSGASGVFAGGTNVFSGQTNSSGVLSSSVFKANLISGTYSVNATGSGVPGSASFSLTNSPGAATSITVVSGSPQSTPVGETFQTLTIRVLDAFSNVVPGVTVNYAAPTSGASIVGTILPQTTNASGEAGSGTLTANNIAGSYTVGATVTGVSSPANFSLTNQPGAAANITATAGTPQSAQVGTPFTTNLQVLVKDASNNPVPGTSVTFTAPTSGASGSFNGGSNSVIVQTLQTGIATASNFSANLTPGSYAVTAAVSGVGSNAQFALSNLTGPPGSISATQGSSQSTTVRTPFAIRFRASVKDAANNPVANVVVRFVAPTTGASGIFTGPDSANTNSEGVAEASEFVANTIAGSYVVLASAPGVSSPASYALMNLPGSAKTIAATGGTPQSAQIGTPFPLSLQATVRDTFGNPLRGVTITFTAPSSGAGGTFAGNRNTAITSDSGVANSEVFVANLTSGNYIVNGSAPGIPTPVDFHLTNTSGQPNGIAIAQGSPQSTQINTAFSTRLAVIVRDAASNPAPGVDITFTLPTSGASGVFLGSNTASTNAAGIATADSLMANEISGIFEVVASAVGVSSPARFTLTNTPSSAASVRTSGGTPQAAQVNTQFVTRFQVTVKDAANNPVSGVTVTFSKPTSGPSGTFQNNDSVAVTNQTGIATAQPFTANSNAGSYTVTARVGGVATPAEFSLTNTTGAPGSITVSAGSAQSTAVNTPFATTFVVRILDGSSNPISGIVVTFKAPQDSATGRFQGGLDSVTTSTNANGFATAPTFTANTIAGNYTVMASAPGVSTPALFSLTNSPGPLNKFSVQSESGNAIGTQLVIVPLNIRVKAQDQFGNTVTAYTGAASTATITSTGTLKSGAGTTAAFTNGVLIHRIVFNKFGSNVTITARRTGSTEFGTSNSFTVNNPSPTLASISPRTGTLQQTLSMTVRGTNFIDSVTTISISGITVNSWIVDSTTQLRANITIPANATLGDRNVIVSNTPPGGGSSLALQFSVELALPPPPVLGGPPNAGSNLRTTLALIWAKSPAAVSYRLQVSTSAAFATRVYDDSTLTDTIKILGPPVIQNGTTYYWRVLAKNTVGIGEFSTAKTFSTIPAYPSTFALSATIPYATKANAGEYLPTEFRIVGLPGEPSRNGIRIPQLMQGTQNIDWVVYHDNGASSNPFVLFDGSPNFDLTVGRAFWVLRKGPWTISTSVPTGQLDTATNSIGIPLHSGWNLITNPFHAPIPWTAVQTLNGGGAMSPPYKYEGSFSIASTLEPYKGYYFFKDQGSSISSLKIPFGTFPASLEKSGSIKHINGWTTGIELLSGGNSDKTMSFGIVEGSKIGLDSLEYRKPRAIGEIPSAYFFRPEWDDQYSTFATDFRPGMHELETWQFDVQSPNRQNTQLLFEGVDRIPTEFDVYLIDVQRAKSLDLRREFAYEFSTPLKKSEFKVVVGTREKVQSVLSSLALKEFSLGNNFPNPFNPTTNIPVEVPHSAEVSLKVYNILGEEVRTIFSGTLAAGRHYFDWNGRNTSGTIVASGIYITRLTTGNGKAFTGKMILMK